MYYSKIDPMSIVDGEGCRVTLFVSGCRNHCPGCFNKATWDFNYGKPFEHMDMYELIAACQRSYIAGLTILGGEPFEPETQSALISLIWKFRAECPGKNLWMFTGYVLEKDLLPGQRKYVKGDTDRILDWVDVLVDGPFIKEQRDLTLQFRGSRNQRILRKEDIARIRSEFQEKLA
jgi:anaerobic ribonucleoside-triphosphate reductase activating protein